MKQEHSYGILPLRKNKKSGEWEVLLVLHQKGFWAFPKGHAEPKEKHEETAKRELKEETGLSVVKLLPVEPFTEHYFFRAGGTLISKYVTYFAAEVAGDIKVQHEEIQDCQWFSLAEAKKQITFKESKAILDKFIAIMDNG